MGSWASSDLDYNFDNKAEVQNPKCKQQKARVFKIRHRYTKDKRWDKDKDRKWGVTLATLVKTCNLQNKIQNDQTMTYTRCLEPFGGYFPSVFMFFNKKQSASVVPPECCNTNIYFQGISKKKEDIRCYGLNKVDMFVPLCPPKSVPLI